MRISPASGTGRRLVIRRRYASGWPAVPNRGRTRRTVRLGRKKALDAIDTARSDRRNVNA